jgi:hypothetical protein
LIWQTSNKSGSGLFWIAKGFNPGKHNGVIVEPPNSAYTQEIPIEQVLEAARVAEKISSAVARIYDESNQPAELFETVIPLCFGYRIVRLKNRISQRSAVRRPLIGHLPG